MRNSGHIALRLLVAKRVARQLGFAAGAVFAGAVVSASAQTPAPVPAPPRVTIAFVDIEGDVRHQPIRAYERVILKLRDHPFAGAQVAIEEAQILSRVLKIDFALERIRVKSFRAIADAVLEAIQERGIRFFIVDAPAEAFEPVAAATRGRDALLFNATAPEDWLRRELCAREIVHTMPSLRHANGRARTISGIAKMARRPGLAGAASRRHGRSQGVRAIHQELRRAS